MGVTTYHICLNIKTLLQKACLDGLFISEEKNNLNDKEARKYLEELLTKGQEVLPPPPSHCNNFDEKTGWCLGHEKN